MHLRLLPEKGKYKFRGVKMEMLVTKFSNGKHRNEGDRDANGEPYRFVLCGEGIRQEYPTERDFKEKANIRGKRLKDIWDLVRDPRFM